MRGVGHARAVVDTDVHELPADAAGWVAPIPRDAVADMPDPPEFLDIQMQQLPRPQPFVADEPGPGRQRLQAGQAQLAQRAGHRGSAQLHRLGDLRARPRELAQALDLHHGGGRDGSRRAVRPARAIRQGAFGRALRPLAGGPGTHPERPADLGQPLPVAHPLGNQGSTVWRRPGILMDVHPGPLLSVGDCLATTTFAERSRMDNLLRHHTVIRPSDRPGHRVHQLGQPISGIPGIADRRAPLEGS